MDQGQGYHTHHHTQTQTTPPHSTPPHSTHSHSHNTGDSPERSTETGSASPSSCSCSNISIMQLFHELKQQFPGVPDHVVSSTIAKHCHDRSSCTDTLQRVARDYAPLTVYPSSLSPRTPVRSRPPPSRCPNVPPPAPAASRPNTLDLETAGREDQRSRSRLSGPLDLSVNLKCRFGEGSACPGLNLTVTPAESGPRRSDEFSGSGYGQSHDRSYGSALHITVSPVSPPSPRPAFRREFAVHRERTHCSEEIPEVEFATPLDSLVWRQKVRLERLERALNAEKARLINMEREIRGLRIPISTSAAHLRPAVQRLRLLCQRLAGQLDQVASNEGFYDNIYTGQRIADESWQCHMCTFRNHALLNKCEECDMPRIILGTSDPPPPSALLPLGSNNTLELDHALNNTSLSSAS